MDTVVAGGVPEAMCRGLCTQLAQRCTPGRHKLSQARTSSHRQEHASTLISTHTCVHVYSHRHMPSRRQVCRHMLAHTLTWSQARVYMNTCIYTDTGSGTYVPMHTHTTCSICTRVCTRAHRHSANALGGTRPGTCSQIHVSTLKDTWAHIVTCTHAHNHRSRQHKHTRT